MTYPTSTAERTARRARIRRIVLDNARAVATVTGRSIKCGELNLHAGAEGGCRNNGTGCICECHDPKETS